MSTSITRADLQRVFGNEPKVIRFFEELFVSSAQAGADAAAAGQATQAIQDATVLTLGPNAAFSNERVLALGSGLQLDTSDGVHALLSLISAIVLNGGFHCAFNLAADTNLDLPTTGRVVTSSVGPYANDAAAAAAGVAVGEIYKGPTGSVVWRQT